MTYEQLIDRLKQQFDVAQSTIESVVNERQREMVADSRWRTSQRSLGTTTAGDPTYALPFTAPAELVHLSEVKVGGVLYEWASETDLWRLNPSDTGRWFAVFNDDTGTPQLQVSPVPSTSGLPITGLVAILPSDMTYASATALSIPSDLHSYLKAGAQADLYEEVDERFDMTAQREQKFQAGVMKLRARKLSYIGPRVTRIQVAGRDFDARG